jgi:hypothetical protein
MIEKIADNKTNLEPLNLNPPEKVKEKLDYYKSLFNKIHDLPEKEFEELKQNIATFFNLKPVGFTDSPPQRILRLSNNNRILEVQGKDVSYLTEISQILAPPIKYCNYGRCNIPEQQVLYCATNEASAYWETKPKRGDVITLSHFELNPNAKVNCTVIRKEKTQNPKISHDLQMVFYLLEEFFVDVFSLEVSKDRQRDYLFSALLSSEQLFYRVPAPHNIEAIIYPSVQKKKYGTNFAIRNDLILERYNLIGVETRFILDECDNLNPESDELTSDNLISSFGTTTFDFENGKILYKEDVDRVFKMFRDLQLNGKNQIRLDKERRNLTFDMSANISLQKGKIQPSKKKLGRNDKVSVVYQNGERKEKIKYKYIEEDIKKGFCRIVQY